MKKILILGAGFGGLRAAIQVAKKLKQLGLEKKYDVILVDKNKYHTYTPLLHEIAAISKTTADFSHLYDIAAYDIQTIIRGSGIKFSQGEIESLDIQDGHAHLKTGERIRFDFLILALGSEANYFGIKGAKENSIPLKSFIDAIKIRDKIWELASEQKTVEVAIGGGGSTGIEFAGELKSWCGQLDHKSKCKVAIRIIEAASNVLPGFDKKIIELASSRLAKLGVKTITGVKIVEAGKTAVVLEDGRKISFDIFVWAGGVKAPAILARLPLEKEGGRAIVKEELAVCLTEDPHLHLQTKIYGIGDTVCFYNPITKRPVPAVARAAISQADVAAHNLIEDIKTSETQIANRKSYSPRHKKYEPLVEYPYVVPIGGKWAVAKIGPFIISGFFGWVLKGLVELNYLLSIMPFWRAIKIWLQGLWIFVRNDRLG